MNENTGKKIGIKVNANRLLENLRMAFSNQHTVLGELLQNARRATATAVEIRFDENTKTLTVIDDGCGIADFQNLLTVAETGWDEGTKAKETPYGMGFLSALYSAHSIEVTSGASHLSMLSSEVIAGKELEVLSMPERSDVTVIALHGFAITDEATIFGKLNTLARGFPIPVFFNGAEIKRDHSEDERFVETSIGMVFIPGIHDGAESLKKTGTIAYLQGLPIYESCYYGITNPTILHLDSTKFRARMPDRDCLVDKLENEKKFHETERELKQLFLEEQAKALPAGEFLKRYEEATWNIAPELFNKLDVIPANALTMLTDYPIYLGNEDCYFIANKKGVTRSMVEAGEISLIEELEEISSDGYGVLANTYVWKKGLVQVSRLNRDHWVWAYVRDITNGVSGEDMGFKIEAVGEKATGRVQEGWVYANLVLCEALVITAPDGDALRFDDIATFSCGSEVLVPENAPYPDEVVRQICNFTDENDYYREEEYERASREFANCVKAMKASNPCDLLKLLLKEIGFGNHPALVGKAFTVNVGEEGEYEVKEAA